MGAGSMRRIAADPKSLRVERVFRATGSRMAEPPAERTLGGRSGDHVALTGRMRLKSRAPF